MLVGIQNALTIMVNSRVDIQNTENRITLSARNSTFKYMLKITKIRIMNIFDPVALFTVTSVQKLPWAEEQLTNM